MSFKLKIADDKKLMKQVSKRMRKLVAEKEKAKPVIKGDVFEDGLGAYFHLDDCAASYRITHQDGLNLEAGLPAAPPLIILVAFEKMRALMVRGHCLDASHAPLICADWVANKHRHSEFVKGDYAGWDTTTTPQEVKNGTTDDLDGEALLGEGR